ncbi:MAG: serine/threonine-protein kinase [Acidobacteriota bacterium]
MSKLRESDAELALLLEGLLSADRAAGDFLEGGAADYASPTLAREWMGEGTAPADSSAGESIGPYRLITLLGRGGMGEVWVAERTDGQFQQRVAVKLLKRGMESEGIRRRFLRERQVLARLEHPHIARLLDGGATSDGRPYFVMELVEGEPITEYCEARDLAVADRLRLIATCAEAVAVAHRRLVVHRDIKPSNVLVDAEGRVKLLDFGIAKVLTDDDGAPGEDPSTRIDERILTPTYAAPEQILGEPVTTATDVYGLGVLLYELMTGSPPHERKTTSPAALAATVDRETTERPSRALLARSGAETSRESRRRSKQLEGDVDAIAQKALRREPERRYAGAAEMAEDVRRHLAGRRVEARPDTVPYRVRKFVRRHRAGVVAAVLVFLALLGGLTTSLWQARVAKQAARRAERIQEFLVAIFQGSDPVMARGDKVTARELLAAGTRRIGTDLRGEPEVQAALYDAVAQIQQSLGALPDARVLAERALSERRRLFGGEDPRTMQSLVTLASVRAAMADEVEAERALRVALPRLANAYGPDSDETIRAKEILADVLVNEGANDEALSLAGELLISRRLRFGAESPETANSLHQVGVIQEAMSHYDDAEKSYRASNGLLDRTLGIDDPRAANGHAALAELLSYRGRRPEAEKEFAITLVSQRKSLGGNHPDLASTLIDLGFLYMNERRYAEADAAFAESLRIYRSLNDGDAASSLRVWALSLIAQEKYPEARQRLDECLAIARARYGPGHQVTLAALGNLGEVQLKSGELGAAETTLRQAIAGLEELFGPEADNLRAPLNDLGETLRARGRVDEAMVLHRRALAIQLKAVGADNPSVPGTRLQLALDLIAQPTASHLAEARRELDLAIELTRKIDSDHPRLDEMLMASGRLARAQNDKPRARGEFQQALDRLRRHHGEKDSRTAEARAVLREI